MATNAEMHRGLTSQDDIRFAGSGSSSFGELRTAKLWLENVSQHSMRKNTRQWAARLLSGGSLKKKYRCRIQGECERSLVRKVVVWKRDGTRTKRHSTELQRCALKNIGKGRNIED